MSRIILFMAIALFSHLSNAVINDVIEKVIVINSTYNNFPEIRTLGFGSLGSYEIICDNKGTTTLNYNKANTISVVNSPRANIILDKSAVSIMKLKDFQSCMFLKAALDTNIGRRTIYVKDFSYFEIH